MGHVRLKILACVMAGVAAAAGCGRPAPEPEPAPTVAAAEAWRPLTEAEIAEAVAQFRKTTPGVEEAPRYAVSADFDGDGRMDEAGFRVSGERYALFARRGAGGPPVRLPYEGPVGGLYNVGLEVLAPGRYATSCGRGAVGSSAPCPKLELKRPAIAAFTWESATAAYFWEAGRFEEEWLTD